MSKRPSGGSRLRFDQGALHAFGRVLAGEARDAVDTQAAIQLGAASVLVDTMEFTPFEARSVLSHSESCLRACELPGEIVRSPRTLDPNYLSELCHRNTASWIALLSKVRFSGAPLPASARPEKIPDSQRRWERHAQSAIANGAIWELAKCALPSSGAGFSAYCLGSSEEALCALLRAVGAVKRSAPWNGAHMDTLLVATRTHLADRYAADDGVEYVPSIGKLDLFPRRRLMVCSAFEAASPCENVFEPPLDFVRYCGGPFACALIQRSRGDWSTLKAERLAMREECAPLRAAIADLLTDAASETSDWEVAQRGEHLANTMRKLKDVRAGRCAPPKLSDSITFGVMPPTLSASAAPIRDWFQFRKCRGPAKAALRAIGYGEWDVGEIRECYEKLVAASMRWQ